MPYTKLTDYAAKDALLSGNPSKVIRGTEIGADLDAVAAADALNLKTADGVTRVAQQNATYITLTNIAGTDTITADATPALTGYVAGQTFRFLVANTNTGAVTININGQGAKSITKEGATTLSAGDLAAGTVIQITYDGVRFQATNGVRATVSDFLNTTRVDVASATTTDLTANAPNTRNINITGTTTITGFTVAIGQLYFVRFNAALTLTNNASIVTQTGASITTATGDTCILRATAANTVEVLGYVQSINNTARNVVPVRQTVLSGPVDTSGFPSFGGSTGSTTVTASGTLRVTAANGFDANGNIDYVGSIVNPSWAGLSTNGTMYLYLDIALNGSCTTGSTTLEPTYRWGGADVVTNNQFTFNIQEMVGKVGNGTTAAQTYRVFVGQVTVAGGVTTALVWYALQGRYDSGYTATLPAAATYTSRNHNIGVEPTFWSFQAKCTTTDAGYQVGDVVSPLMTGNNVLGQVVTRLTVGNQSGSAGYSIPARTTGVATTVTVGNWSYRFIAQRGW